jgi:hypothetical protein
VEEPQQRPGEDPITFRLRVAQAVIGQCLHNLRELTGVLAILAIEAHERGIVSDESFESVKPSLDELDTLLTKSMELFLPEGS